MGIDHLGGKPVVPAVQRAVLDKVAWPTVAEVAS
jgi:hypothetical protein